MCWSWTKTLRCAVKGNSRAGFEKHLFRQNASHFILSILKKTFSRSMGPINPLWVSAVSHCLPHGQGNKFSPNFQSRNCLFLPWPSPRPLQFHACYFLMESSKVMVQKVEGTVVILWAFFFFSPYVVNITQEYKFIVNNECIINYEDHGEISDLRESALTSLM